MLSASIAEWILARVTSRDRAATVVGDLIEIERQKGSLWFSLSVAGVVISLVWRRTLAFVAAFYVGMWAMSTFGNWAIGKTFIGLNGIVLELLTLTACRLWAASLYATVRYGVADRSAQMALASTGLVTAVIYFWWQPALLKTCITIAVFFALASVLTSKSRKAALVVVLEVVVGWLSMMATLAVTGLYQHCLLSGPWGDQEMLEHPSLSRVFIGMLILSLWVSTLAWSRIHDWLTPSGSPLSEVEG
jgi:hypothetical protein